MPGDDDGIKGLVGAKRLEAASTPTTTAAAKKLTASSSNDAVPKIEDQEGANGKSRAVADGNANAKRLDRKPDVDGPRQSTTSGNQALAGTSLQRQRAQDFPEPGAYRVGGTEPTPLLTDTSFAQSQQQNVPNDAALDAEVVTGHGETSKEFNERVQQRMDARTVDAIKVRTESKSATLNDVERSLKHKQLMCIFGTVVTIGVLLLIAFFAGDNKEDINDSAITTPDTVTSVPTSPPTMVDYENYVLNLKSYQDSA